LPLTKLQMHVLRVLATGRSPDNYIAGGIAVNREGPRFSGDIDIFQDSEQRLGSAAEADAKTLSGKREAEPRSWRYDAPGVGSRQRLPLFPDATP
jgi:hypothetical protein